MTNRNRARGPRRKLLWVPHSEPESTSTIGAVDTTGDMLAAFLADVGAETRPGMTIMRIVGVLSVRNPAITNIQARWTFALKLMQENATSFPLPESEIEDFLYWTGGTDGPMGTEVATDVFAQPDRRIEFDVRSRRKLSGVGNEMIGLMQTPSGGQVVTWSIQTRTLIALP